MNRGGDIVRVRSHTCTGIISRPGGQSCDACAKQVHSQDVQQVIQRAMTETPKNGLNINYYSFKQLNNLVDLKEEKLKTYRLKVRLPSP